MSASAKSLAGRIFAFCAGLLLTAMGVSLTVKADLGTTAISSLPFVAALDGGFSIGTFLVLLNLALVAAELLIMRGKFPRAQYFQIPASFLFGFLTDFWMTRLPEFAASPYLTRLAVLAAATLILSFGIFVMVRANVTVMAAEGFVMVLSLVTRKDFGTIKSLFDSTLVILAVLLSLALYGEIHGAREGTVLSAVFVGLLLKGFNALWNRHAGKKGPPLSA